jgi:hypothetical protein
MLSTVNVLTGSEQTQFTLVKQVFWVLQLRVTPVGFSGCEIWLLSKRLLEIGALRGIFSLAKGKYPILVAVSLRLGG